MSDCASIDPLVTAYVDDELGEADRTTIDRHLGVCEPCRSRVGAEQNVRALLLRERAAFCGARAPAVLGARCRAAVVAGAPPAEIVPLRPRHRSPLELTISGARRAAPIAIAATVLLAVGAAAVYQASGSSVRVLAAELAADHVKCAAMNRLTGTEPEPHEAAEAGVEQLLASSFAWDARLPEAPEREGLELVGSRVCLYGRGRVAHIMYRDIRHLGQMVSVFMIPGQVRTAELVRSLGHEASVWSDGRRTFVLMARQSRPEVERLASFVHQSLR